MTWPRGRVRRPRRGESDKLSRADFFGSLSARAASPGTNRLSASKRQYVAIPRPARAIPYRRESLVRILRASYELHVRNLPYVS